MKLFRQTFEVAPSKLKRRIDVLEFLLCHFDHAPRTIQTDSSDAATGEEHHCQPRDATGIQDGFRMKPSNQSIDLFLVILLTLGRVGNNIVFVSIFLECR